MTAARIEVRDIDVRRDAGVTVTWADDHVCHFALEELRANCPCAGCRSLRDRGEVPWPRPGVSAVATLADAELVGAWGLSLTWADGHTAGIYPWDGLRAWCDGRTAQR